MFVFCFVFVLTSFDDCFCVDSFCFLRQPISSQYFPQFVFSVSLGLRKIQLLDLGYRLADLPLRGMQDVDRVGSDRTSNEN